MEESGGVVIWRDTLTKSTLPEQETYLASVLQKCSVLRGECNLERPEQELRSEPTESPQET